MLFILEKFKQWFTPSKATELCTAAYTITKALKTIVLTIV
jgi:hypothetical protein